MLHWYPAYVFPVFKMLVSPSQMRSSPLICGCGAAVTVTLASAVAVHPLLSVTVRLYEIGTVELWLAAVEPFDHKKVLPAGPTAVATAVCPSQMSRSPEMEAEGRGHDTMFALVVPLQPLAAVTVTE